MSPRVADSDGPKKRPPAAQDDPPRKRAAAPVGLVIEAEPPESVWTWREFYSVRNLASLLVSCAFHVAVIVVLSLLVALIPQRESRTLIVSTEPSDGADARDLDDSRVIATDSAAPGGASSLVPLNTEPELNMSADQLISGETPPTKPTWDPDFATPSDALMRTTNMFRGGFEGRSGELKQRLLGEGGGTPQSQEAVDLALVWLAAHQWQDGGWRLNLADSRGPCQGRCGDSGKVATSTGATGLALLPFLGAGHTHLAGEYRDVVHNGLYYLKGRAIKTAHGVDLQEGSMYGHGIATIALCEAYAMTQDASLRDVAQKAIDFICYAQHSGGGWRYEPNMPGDTTVFGWQMMALKSAAIAGLDVPTPVINLGERFLDSVQTGDGAYYGYLIRGKSPGPTAVGLLIRMYTGWPQDDPRLARGVAYLVAQQRSRHDMYFNYYATQVLHHHNGPEWPKWNEEMREYLIKTQATSGHERGSWFFPDQHGSQGGRLYTTAVCAMILEVYYRHMPLYRKVAVEDDWW